MKGSIFQIAIVALLSATFLTAGLQWCCCRESHSNGAEADASREKTAESYGCCKPEDAPERGTPEGRIPDPCSCKGHLNTGPRSARVALDARPLDDLVDVTAPGSEGYVAGPMSIGTPARASPHPSVPLIILKSSFLL